jgi:hypothetical protein
MAHRVDGNLRDRLSSISLIPLSKSWSKVTGTLEHADPHLQIAASHARWLVLS